jgi:hypothetical protein
MGQAFDKDGRLLGEAEGETRREVLDQLERDHPDADEMRIHQLREKLDKLTDADQRLVEEERIKAIVKKVGTDGVLP